MLPDFKCIIIDDEPKAIELLQQRLKLLFPDVRILGAFAEWQKGYEAIRSQKIDLLFLDVSMPEKSGIDFLKLFPKTDFDVIFVTAHSQFAVDAIKFSASGYVLKPIDDYELSFAVNKVIEKRKFQAESGNAKPGDNKEKTKIGIPNPKGIDYLNAGEILYFESVNKYTKVVTKDHSLLSSYNLGEFKKLIDERIFFQVHRSYIVNLYKIKRYEISGTLIMEDNMQIPVSRNVRTEFMSVFGAISKTVGFKGRDYE